MKTLDFSYVLLTGMAFIWYLFIFNANIESNNRTCEKFIVLCTNYTMCPDK